MSIKAADKIFADIIKKRDVQCVLCNSTVDLDPAHYVPRRYFNTRYDEKNVALLCRYWCHRYLTDHPEEHEKFFVELLTKEVTVDLWIKANKPAITYKSFYGSKIHLKELRLRHKDLE